MLTRTANGDPRTSLWLRVREFAVPPSMVETATARRRAGDWAGACAAAGFDIDLHPRTVARTHGSDLAARVRADLRRLAPDLLRWHMPRIAPDGLLRPGLTLTLARYEGAGQDGVRPVHLVVRTAPAWADAGQRISLALWDGSAASTGPGRSAHPHPRPDRRFRLDLHRHLWDADRAGELRVRSGADLDPADAEDPAVTAVRNALPHGHRCAVDRWPDEARILLRAEGRADGPVLVRCGTGRRVVVDVGGEGFGAGLPGAALSAVRLASGATVSGLRLAPDAGVSGPRLAPDAGVSGPRLASDAGVSGPRLASDVTVSGLQLASDATLSAPRPAPSGTVSALRPASGGTVSTGPLSSRPASTGPLSGVPVLPDAATWVPPDLDLIRTGALDADRLHPLVASALVPDHVPSGPFRAPDPVGRPRTVDCRGARHRIGLVDGSLAALDHPAEQIRREELLVALTGTPLPCLAAIDEAHRRPDCLGGVRERLDHGDVTGALAVVEGLLGPQAVLRDGPLRDALEAAARQRITYGLFRAGLIGPGHPRLADQPHPRTGRSHPRHSSPS